MHKKNSRLLYFVILSLVLMLFISCSKDTARYNSTSNNVQLSVDSKNQTGLPEKFRKTNSAITSEENKMPNLYGFNSLNESGSAQFCGDGLEAIKASIGKKTLIIDIDLRQESHGFINGMAVSWANKGNNANKGLTKKQVLEEEESKLKSIKLNKPVTYSNDFTVLAKEVTNENDLVKNKGMEYIRIPVTDVGKPTKDMVDYFVQFIRDLPEDAWLHFHCKHGVGRTTTFMVMYDSMRNAKNVTLEDILSRQILIGGKDLFEGTDGIEVNAVKRSEFITEFYRYCKENKDNYKTTWSEWVKENNIDIR